MQGTQSLRTGMRHAVAPCSSYSIPQGQREDRGEYAAALAAANIGQGCNMNLDKDKEQIWQMQGAAAVTTFS